MSPFLFLVNPASGTGSVSTVLDRLNQLDKSLVEIVQSESIEHTNAIIKQALKERRKAVIAVGGDGTVHSIGKALIGTDTALGIIPVGSGNGIARHLSIPMNLTKAIDCAIMGTPQSIDTFRVNDAAAIGFAGIGFDGFVAKEFHQHRQRGFWSYVRLTLKAYRSYQPTAFSIDGEHSEQFALVIGNISQYGNNAMINPVAVDDDGKIELVLLQKPKVGEIPWLGYQLFNSQIQRSKLVRIHSKAAFTIKNSAMAPMHIDGEPVISSEEISVEVNPNSLTVITP